MERSPGLRYLHTTGLHCLPLYRHEVALCLVAPHRCAHQAPLHRHRVQVPQHLQRVLRRHQHQVSYDPVKLVRTLNGLLPVGSLDDNVVFLQPVRQTILNSSFHQKILQSLMGNIDHGLCEVGGQIGGLLLFDADSEGQQSACSTGDF